MNREKKDFSLYLNYLYEEKMKVYDFWKLDDYKKDLYQYSIQHSLSLLIYEIFKYKRIRDYQEALMKVGNSKMVQESLKSNEVDIDQLRLSCLYKKIIKSIQKRKYGSAATYLALNQVYHQMKVFFVRVRNKVLLRFK